MNRQIELDEAIEMITRVRVSAIKSGNPEIEKALYEVEQKLFQLYDKILPENIVMDFKVMRARRGLTLRQVEEATGISNSYLSQLENGKIIKPSHHVVKKLTEYYSTLNHRSIVDPYL